MKTVSWDDTQEDVIIVHLGRIVSDEIYAQIIKSITNLLELRYPVDKPWHLES